MQLSNAFSLTQFTERPKVKFQTELNILARQVVSGGSKPRGFDRLRRGTPVCQGRSFGSGTRGSSARLLASSAAESPPRLAEPLLIFTLSDAAVL